MHVCMHVCVRVCVCILEGDGVYHYVYVIQVDILRVECNQSIDKMGVEIHRLEQVRWFL